MRRFSGRSLEVACYEKRSPRGSLPKRWPDTSTLWKIIYCIQCFNYDNCSSLLLLKFSVYSKQHSSYSKYRDQTIRQVIAYNRLKTRENYLTLSPNKWSRRLAGSGWIGGHGLQEEVALGGKTMVNRNMRPYVLNVSRRNTLKSLVNTLVNNSLYPANTATFLQARSEDGGLYSHANLVFVLLLLLLLLFVSFLFCCLLFLINKRG